MYKFFSANNLKCFFNAFTALFIFMFLPLNVYAGDIPEGLLEFDNSIVYIGELKSISSTGDLTFIEKLKIKGNFKADKEDLIKSESYFENLKVGKTYLVGYAPDNIRPWILEAYGSDTETLIIKDDSDMAKRMENYIHEGKFKQADEQINAEKNGESSIESTSAKNHESNVSIVSNIPGKQKFMQLQETRKHILVISLFLIFIISLFMIKDSLNKKNE